MAQSTTPLPKTDTPLDECAIAEDRRRRNHWLRTNGRCWYCGDSFSVADMHLDHTHSKAQGGRGLRRNLVPACAACNTAKGRKGVEEFRRYRERQRDQIPYFSPTQLAWMEAHGLSLPEVEPFVFWFEQEGLA